MHNDLIGNIEPYTTIYELWESMKQKHKIIFFAKFHKFTMKFDIK